MKLTAIREALNWIPDDPQERGDNGGTVAREEALAEVERAERMMTGWRFGANGYRLWCNEEKTVLVRIWENGLAEVATRHHEAETWGAPTHLYEERT